MSSNSFALLSSVIAISVGGGGRGEAEAEGVGGHSVIITAMWPLSMVKREV
jgi:hypothetical protein